MPEGVGVREKLFPYLRRPGNRRNDQLGQIIREDLIRPMFVEKVGGMSINIS